MKINVLVDKDVLETEITIKCKSIDDKILKLQEQLLNNDSSKLELVFFKDNKEHYFDLGDIIFFETEANIVYAHTKNDAFLVKYRLYELEDLLPRYFLRISKSTIVNVKKIFSLNKNIASSSLIEFYNTHKQVYVSRKYLKILHDKIKEERYHEKN